MECEIKNTCIKTNPRPLNTTTNNEEEEQGEEEQEEEEEDYNDVNQPDTHIVIIRQCALWRPSAPLARRHLVDYNRKDDAVDDDVDDDVDEEDDDEDDAADDDNDKHTGRQSVRAGARGEVIGHRRCRRCLRRLRRCRRRRGGRCHCRRFIRS